MRRFLFLASVCLLAAISASAQVNPQLTGAGAPSGSCTSTQTYLDTTGHNFYYCNNGTWSTSQGLGNQTVINLATSSNAIPGIPGLNAVPVTSGLMAEYRMLPSETPASLIDYSGNGRNATGTVGSAPTVAANTGGLTCSGSGAVILPASLNSALTIQVLSWARADGPSQAPVMGNGAGATSGGTGIVYSLSGLPASSMDALTDGLRVQSTNGGSLYYAQSKGTVTGPTNVALVMDTVDRLYINGKEETTNYAYGTQLRSSSGLQTTGAYQLCGSATGTATSLYMLSNTAVYYVLFYNRLLNPAEVMQNAQFMRNAMMARGIITPDLGSPVNMAFDTTATPSVPYADTLVLDGDSITQGTGLTTPFSAALVFPTAYTVIANQGNPLEMMANMALNADQSVDPFYRPQANRNVVTIWGGTNDNCTPTAAQILSNLASYSRGRRAVGFKVLVATMLSRASEDTCKNNYNALIRQYWWKWADGLIDIAADANLGADGANANTTYFQAGNVHPTQFAAYNDVAPVFQRAIARAYGNLDFSAATTYASAAAAAVATTAGSESGNTATITFAATPANCLAGNTITIAGTTPAGYVGSFDILTRSATQVTYYLSTTGLGAISVQGTGVCPQQQDADVASVLNFGAGNFTLESCVGYTGQNIAIKNINGSGSTIVPFGTETIDGAANLAIASKATVVLQSILTSAAAGGCNWKQLQNN